MFKILPNAFGIFSGTSAILSEPKINYDQIECEIVKMVKWLPRLSRIPCTKSNAHFEYSICASHEPKIIAAFSITPPANKHTKNGKVHMANVQFDTARKRYVTLLPSHGISLPVSLALCYINMLR